MFAALKCIRAARARPRTSTCGSFIKTCSLVSKPISRSLPIRQAQPVISTVTIDDDAMVIDTEKDITHSEASTPVHVNGASSSSTGEVMSSSSEANESWAGGDSAVGGALGSAIAEYAEGEHAK